MTGLLAGPDILGIISRDSVNQLGFINQVALAIIALAAGNELVLKEYRSQFRSIAWVTIGLVVTTFSFGSLAMYLLTAWVPILDGLPMIVKISVFYIPDRIRTTTSGPLPQYHAQRIGSWI